MSPTPARPVLATAVATLLAVGLTLLAVVIAMIGGHEVEVAGAFFVLMLALLLAFAAIVGLARCLHDDPTAGRRVVKRGLVVVVMVGLCLTIGLAVAIGWPYALAALLPLGVLAVLVRDVLTD